MADYKIITLRNLLRAPTLSLLCWQMCGQSQSQLTFHQENLAIFQNCSAKVAGFHERNRNLCMSFQVKIMDKKAKKQITGSYMYFFHYYCSPKIHIMLAIRIKYFALNSNNISVSSYIFTFS